ncbi:HAD family hydrolase [Oceanicola sp. D3]|uniref:HAD family hydrolase n=1 Tax=Oceanicola sp. D3 TaxID=2587163 RepID=UPI00111D9266|nr:HAD family hydrolase [Oceanicola sp. D3]QDC10235.1 HAD family hydrolase [Oceanicola sp. D3]
MTVPKLKGLLFDKDGTLFDYQKTWGSFTLGFVEGLAAGDADLAIRLARAIGVNPETAQFSPDSPIVAGTPEEAIAPLLPLLPGWSLAALTDHINTAAARAPQVPAADLGPLVEALRANGHTLGIATNDAEAAALAHVESAGLQGQFAFLAGYDSGHGAKPSPGMCLAFASAVGIAPQACAMIGDSLHDLAAGRAAGMFCIAVCTGVTPPEELAPHADLLLPDIGHLPQFLPTP